ncbi:TraC family protein [Aurantimonas sp. C2-6-R+9]|uniref:TraC family protein n=1 Tax=unclassified Aurantimonas TaxID=2638230 RepID=UPI002E16D0E8|nr:MULTISPECIES: TraC family protein [unclassified Aurantimonas]MEC5291923.1 TraC family protein [Aurantimonas sp. C2-3-R2]MEC5382732.1 TraC family protein [Aurantimonas sp. C2-6-R+9]MEC5413009.1 TraC family protein [Aurantimonas sp. C2-4-R8]
MAKRKTAQQIKDEIEALEKQMRGISVSEEARAGKLLRKSGVLDLNLSESEMLKAFEEMAATFRGKGGRGQSNSKADASETGSSEANA